jgi:hypothetical protein
VTAAVRAAAAGEGAPSWMAGGLAPAATVRRLSLGGRQLLFCERRQQLFELEPAAAAAWDALAAGAPSTAADQASLRAWVDDGWLIPEAVTARCAGPPGGALLLRPGGCAVALTLRLQPGDRLAGDLQDAFGQFAEPHGARAPADAMRLDLVGLEDGYWLHQDGAPGGRLSPGRVTPEVKAVITDRLCRRDADGGLLLHAALLGRGGEGLLLCGAPGAGKSTLATALAARGLDYGSDDLVQVSRDGRFHGVGFSPSIKAGAWDLLAASGLGVETLPTHQRADGQAVRYLPAARLPAGEIVRPRWLLLLAREAGAQPELQPVDPVTAMTEVLASAFSADHRLSGDALVALAARFAAMQAYRLVYSDLGSAVACVEALVDG